MTFIYSTSIPQAWPQPLDPLHSVVLSAGTATVPLIVVLLLMGWLRKSGLFASACGLGTAASETSSVQAK